MAEKIFGAQVNYGWGLSLNMTGKAPAVAKRIFDTYKDAFDYANDVNDSAIEGLVLSVVADSDATKNGLYFVKQIAIPAVEADEEKGIEGVDAKEAILVKISTNANSQATADEVQDNLDLEVQARKDADNVLSGAIDTNAEAIEGVAEDLEDLASANTEAHTALSGAIDTNAEAIEGVAKDLEDLASANAEAHTALSGAIDTNAEAIEGINTTIGEIQDDIQSLIDENSAAHGVLSGAIDTNKAILDTLKIKDVKSNDKMLAVDADGKLSSTFTVDYVANDNKIYFKGLNNAELGEIDTTDFVKDGMLQNVSIDKTGGKTELVFTWNIADETNPEDIKITRLAVNDFLDGTELSSLQHAFDVHVAETETLHFSSDDRAHFDALIQNYSKTQLDEKFATINNSFTANTEAHTTLSQEIASANTRIDTVGKDLEDLASANTEAHTALSGEIEGVAKDLEDLTSANTEAHTALSGAIDTNAEAIEGVAKDLEDLASANAEAHTALSGAIDTNAEAIEGVAEDLAELASANTEAHTALSGAIDTNAEAIENLASANTKAHTELSEAIEGVAKDLEDLTSANTEAHTALSGAIDDLKANKVSSVSAVEGSNIVVNEVKNDNGISYTIGFQWLTF